VKSETPRIPALPEFKNARPYAGLCTHPPVSIRFLLRIGNNPEKIIPPVFAALPGGVRFAA
jgi:hypothetical protein